MPTAEIQHGRKPKRYYGSKSAKALMLNPRTIRGTLFLHKHPLLKTYLRQFFKWVIAWPLRKPWVQKKLAAFRELTSQGVRVVDQKFKKTAEDIMTQNGKKPLPLRGPEFRLVP
jgi:hypothetical protein